MNYVIVFFIIGSLIFIHELGHFLAARWIKIPIARFSVGFGPKIWKFKKGKTEYCLSLIPIGGYVLPEFEDESEFFQFPVYKRIIFSIGGPFANLVLPIILFGILNAINSGFSFTEVFIEPFPQTLSLLYKFLCTIPLLFSSSAEISGIVGIVSQGGKLIGSNILNVLNFSIIISLNLAVFNLLPIPALDGGKIILYLLEKIHPKLLRIHLPLTLAGWMLLIGIMIYATVLDIGRNIL